VVAKFPQAVVAWFARVFSTEEVTIQLITEITLGMNTTTPELIRAHPDYRGGGPWYDCVDVKYEASDPEQNCVYPARCACFFEWPASVNPQKIGMCAAECPPQHLLCLVHECNYQSAQQVAGERPLYSHYTLKGVLSQVDGRQMRLPIFKCLHPQSFAGRVYVIDPQPDNGNVFYKEPKGSSRHPVNFDIIKVKDRKSLWPKAFLESGSG
jgi:hypothetical protein